MSGEDNPHFSPFGTLDPGALKPANSLVAAAAYMREHPEVEAMFDEPTAKTLAELTGPRSEHRGAGPRAVMLASAPGRP